jgi:hypothetical protein
MSSANVQLVLLLSLVLHHRLLIITDMQWRLIQRAHYGPGPRATDAKRPPPMLRLICF